MCNLSLKELAMARHFAGFSGRETVGFSLYPRLALKRADEGEIISDHQCASCRVDHWVVMRRSMTGSYRGGETFARPHSIMRLASARAPIGDPRCRRKSRPAG